MDKYTTEVTLKIKFEHWQTTTPEQVVQILRSMVECPAVQSIEVVATPITTPEWPYNRKKKHISIPSDQEKCIYCHKLRSTAYGECPTCGNT